MAEIWWEPGLIGLEIKLYGFCCTMQLPSRHIYVGRGVGTEVRGWHGSSSLLFLRDPRKIPCFKIYLRFCFYSSMVKPTDEEVTAIEKVDFYSQFPGEGWIPGHIMQDRTRKHQSWSRGESTSQSLFFFFFFCGFYGKKWVKRGRKLSEFTITTFEYFWQARGGH